MLRTTTKNVAHEVVSCLIEASGRGVLTDIIRWLKNSQQNILNDHLSILDYNFEAPRSSKGFSSGQDGMEGDEAESGYYNPPDKTHTISEKRIPHNYKKAQSKIRIKVRKSSVEPHSSKNNAVGSRFKKANSTIRKPKQSVYAYPTQTEYEEEVKEDKDVSSENIRAGSPLNYMRDKRKRKEDGSGTVIVMQSADPS